MRNVNNNLNKYLSFANKLKVQNMNYFLSSYECHFDSHAARRDALEKQELFVWKLGRYLLLWQHQKHQLFPFFDPMKIFVIDRTE